MEDEIIEPIPSRELEESLPRHQEAPPEESKPVPRRGLLRRFPWIPLFHLAILLPIAWLTSLYALNTHGRWTGDHEDKLRDDIGLQTRIKGDGPDGKTPLHEPDWSQVWRKTRYWNDGLISTAGDSLVLSPLIHYSLRHFGNRPIGYRFPNAFLTFLLIPLLYFLGLVLYRPSVGFFAALFLAVSPAYATYARLAHFVGSSTTVLMLIYLSAVLITVRRQRLWWIGLVLGLAAMPYFYSTLRYMFVLAFPIVLHGLFGLGNLWAPEVGRILREKRTWLRIALRSLYARNGNPEGWKTEARLLRLLRKLNYRRAVRLREIMGAHGPVFRAHWWIAFLALVLVIASWWPNLSKRIGEKGIPGAISSFYYARGETLADMIKHPIWVEFTLGYRLSYEEMQKKKGMIFWSAVRQRARETGRALLGVLRHPTIPGHWSPFAQVFLFWLIPAFWIGFFFLCFRMREPKSAFLIVWILLSIAPLLFTSRFHAARFFVGFPAYCLVAALGLTWSTSGVIRGFRNLRCVLIFRNQPTGERTRIPFWSHLAANGVFAVGVLCVLILAGAYTLLVVREGLRDSFHGFDWRKDGADLLWLWEKIGMK